MKKVEEVFILTNKINSEKKGEYPFEISKINITECNEVFVEGIQSYTGGYTWDIKNINELSEVAKEAVKELLN